jgi:hypothetical protein
MDATIEAITKCRFDFGLDEGLSVILAPKVTIPNQLLFMVVSSSMSEDEISEAESEKWREHNRRFAFSYSLRMWSPTARPLASLHSPNSNELSNKNSILRLNTDAAILLLIGSDFA